MRNSDILQNNSKLKTILGQKQLVLAVFRIASLSIALIDLAYDDPTKNYLPGMVIALGAAFYTFFKLVHPLRWYASKFSGIALTAIDVIVCAILIVLHREIHTPFAVYALNPILISALFLPAKFTWITGAVTAVYYTMNYFSYPLTTSLESLSGMFSTYLIALGLTAWLPYIINSHILQGLQSRVINEERHKMGRNLHDGLCQTIYGLRLELQSFRRNANRAELFDERLAHLTGLLDEAEKEARGSVELLRSFQIDRPLLQHIEDSLRHLESEFGIGYRLEAPQGEPRLDDLVKLEVLHVCEEALINVAKHSGARQVTVRVNALKGNLQISIGDDGRGITGDGLAKGHGLTVMKERAELLGGHFRTISSPGAGTEIQVEVPQKRFWELQTI